MRSDVAPGQLVSSNSCKCRSWIKLDKPVDVKRGQPANERICMLLMPQMCWSPKSRIWVHQRRYRVCKASMVEMYPIPISVICTHLQKKPRVFESGSLKSNSVKMFHQAFSQNVIWQHFWILVYYRKQMFNYSNVSELDRQMILFWNIWVI